jgi:cytochrome o ubiquinol oxidase subunit 1
MGATRRMDHYDPSMGWQGLFIVAGIGAVVIFMGVGFQILQLLVSIRQRKATIDTTGDPWNGRTLEWSTVSPAPFYNFAVLPVVHERDAFWAMKRSGREHSEKPEYEDIRLPKNSGMGLVIAAFAFIFGFAVIWHIWWLAPLSLFGIIGTIILRISDEDTEYVVTAEELAEYEKGRA